VAAALLARYTVEIEQYWAPLIAAAHTLTTAKFAGSLIERTEGILSATARPISSSAMPESRFLVAPRPEKLWREAFVQAFQANKTGAFIRGSASHCQRRRGNGKGISVGDCRDSSKPTSAP